MMDFSEIITLATENLLVTIVIILVILFILYRTYKTVRIHIGTKKYVSKAKRLDKKRFNGFSLVDKIRRKRKRNSNSFAQLKKRARIRVRLYFSHKAEELPVFTRFSYGKLFKRSSDKLTLIIKNEKKTLCKISMKKGVKAIIEATNKYDCLDEMIIFLHNLPGAIIEQQSYEIFSNNDELMITYQIK